MRASARKICVCSAMAPRLLVSACLMYAEDDRTPRTIAEPRLPMLLKMMLWAQQQLDGKLAYPRISNLVTATLEPPAAD